MVTLEIKPDLNAAGSGVKEGGGAVLNCWGGDAAGTASSGKVDGNLDTKVNCSYNGKSCSLAMFMTYPTRGRVSM